MRSAQDVAEKSAKRVQCGEAIAFTMILEPRGWSFC